jgi:hypothetical protein
MPPATGGVAKQLVLERECAPQIQAKTYTMKKAKGTISKPLFVGYESHSCFYCKNSERSGGNGPYNNIVLLC